MRVSSLSDIGLVRKTNEDNHLVQKEKGLFIVADGMGGHKEANLQALWQSKPSKDFTIRR